MKVTKLEFNKLKLKSNKPPHFYENEAKSILKRLNTGDFNFKYFIKKIINESLDSVDTETWRDIVSILQKHVCKQLNLEESDESVLIPLRDKIKRSKRQYFDN